jgi:hypothetical protein
VTPYQFTVTIGASAVNLATAAVGAGAVLPGTSLLFTSTYIPAAKISVQSLDTNTGRVYIGPSTVTSSGGNAMFDLAAGQLESTESQNDHNVLNLASYYIHGSHSTDLVLVTYHQA